ncbi:MAG: methylglyoxal synthase [Eubacteriales bacterium]|nr:methylglyoxal synthase [Eubacteriales bacterium]
MKIVVLADSRKNELLINFCIAYSQLLANHSLYSTMNTARLVEASTPLKFIAIPNDTTGAINQLAQMAFYNEIDAVIYLRDSLFADYSEPNSLMESCDRNNIPYASNIASAEILVLAIDRGDLDWRELLR